MRQLLLAADGFMAMRKNDAESCGNMILLFDTCIGLMCLLVFRVAENHLNGCLVLQHNDTEPQFSVLQRLAEELLFSVIYIAGEDWPQCYHLKNAIC
ncbi:hypothetical protein HGM15179_009931 [Zosterops borbonicus]|uniref:Uncharacterized protein n=1 Tax=Zosterops borbonicus TaxID=364589 RepID=A0A8K1GFI8_9PASS|nr:hypothetical protein HGM15179_009931 [Zosterops borbonicus]